jgi:hypothetical protein
LLAKRLSVKTMLRIYVSQTSGSYPGYMPQRPKEGKPDGIAPAVPDLVLEIACTAIAMRLTIPGVWYKARQSFLYLAQNQHSCHQPQTRQACEAYR